MSQPLPISVPVPPGESLLLDFVVSDSIHNLLTRLSALERRGWEKHGEITSEAVRCRDKKEAKRFRCK